MFETFRDAFVQDEREDPTVVEVAPAYGNVELDMLFGSFGGRSFNQGMYRIISAGSMERWGQRVSAAYPSFAGRLACFGIDWLGRVFALDSSRRVEGAPGVVLLEPGTGEALETPCTLQSFHEVELLHHREEALAESFYVQWRSGGAPAPRFNQCIGYKQPLFLGGLDTVDNLEVATLEVYWDLTSQLLDKTRGLAIGTPVNNITIR